MVIATMALTVTLELGVVLMIAGWCAAFYRVGYVLLGVGAIVAGLSVWGLIG